MQFRLAKEILDKSHEILNQYDENQKRKENCLYRGVPSVGLIGIGVIFMSTSKTITKSIVLIV